MSYKQLSPLPVVEGGTGTQLFEMAVGGQGFGVIVCGQFRTDPLQVLQHPGTAGQFLMSNGVSALPSFENVSAVGVVSTLSGDVGGFISPSAGNTNINDNTIIGNSAGNSTLTGNSNTALGDNTLANLTSGVAGVYIGNLAGVQITTGGANVCVGSLAGFNYAGNEHSNICIGSGVEGTLGENNTLRIGEGTGTGAGFLNKAYICGIRSINVGSVATVVTENNDQLG